MQNMEVKRENQGGKNSSTLLKPQDTKNQVNLNFCALWSKEARKLCFNEILNFLSFDAWANDGKPIEYTVYLCFMMF